jgi:Zn-dependent protease
MDMLIHGLGWYLAFVLSVTFHEAAHAFTALKLGDRTAYLGGQVTLDPVPHIQREPFGMVLVPILSFIYGGWMIGWGSAPYDPQWALDYPKRSCAMALAGPAANLILIIAAGILIRIGLAMGLFVAPESITYIQAVAPADNAALAGVAGFVSILFSLNVILFFFNLLPVPPLDGSAIPLLFLDRSTARRYMTFLFNPSASWIGLLIAWYGFGSIFPPLHLHVINLLYLGVARYG